MTIQVDFTPNALRFKIVVVATSSGNRFFCGYGKGGSIQTAWHIAGAKRFLHDEDVLSVIDNLQAKKKKYSVQYVECTLTPADLLVIGA